MISDSNYGQWQFVVKLVIPVKFAVVISFFCKVFRIQFKIVQTIYER
jgi:hypothetical protein